MFDIEPYKRVELDQEQSELIYDIIYDFVNELDNDDLKRIKAKIGIMVDYIQGNLPEGVDRVDGYCVQPLLEKVCQDIVIERSPATTENE